MNSVDARRILIACRPGTDDLRSTEAVAALEQAHRDPDLQRWWEQHQDFQNQVRESFRAIQTPKSLHSRILMQAKIIAVPWWRQPVVWKAAAAIALLCAVVAVWRKPSSEDSFQTFRSRVVRNVLRSYSMDIQTSDMAQIRRFLATNNAPADFVLPQRLGQLPAQGAGLLSWRDRHVSMVCLDSGAQGTLFLFIVDRAAVKSPPPERQYAAVSELTTVSWSERGETYVLAGRGGKEALQQFR